MFILKYYILEKTRSTLEEETHKQVYILIPISVPLFIKTFSITFKYNFRICTSTPIEMFGKSPVLKNLPNELRAYVFFLYSIILHSSQATTTTWQNGRCAKMELTLLLHGKKRISSSPTMFKKIYSILCYESE